MTGAVAATVAMARKDLLSEWRSRELLPAVAQFAVLALVIANFGFQLDREVAPGVVSGVLWLVLVFAGLLSFARAFAHERDLDTLEALMLTAAPPAAVLAGKSAAAAVVLLATEGVLLAGLALFFGAPVLSASLIAALLLATVGLSVVGCLFSALAAMTRARDLLLPVLALPVWVPFVVVGGDAVRAAVAGGGDLRSLGLLAAFDILFGVAALEVARFVLDD